MKIDEAIKILTDMVLPDEDGDAVKLGIKALERIQEQRELGDTHPDDILPGEDKE